MNECWLCDKANIVYEDALGMFWCARCFRETHWDEDEQPE